MDLDGVVQLILDGKIAKISMGSSQDYLIEISGETYNREGFVFGFGFKDLILMNDDQIQQMLNNKNTIKFWNELFYMTINTFNDEVALELSTCCSWPDIFLNYAPSDEIARKCIESLPWRYLKNRPEELLCNLSEGMKIELQLKGLI